VVRSSPGIDQSAGIVQPNRLTDSRAGQHSDGTPDDDDVTGRKSKESPPDVVGVSGAAGGDSASEGPG
jgi:hypothetical protein